MVNNQNGPQRFWFVQLKRWPDWTFLVTRKHSEACNRTNIVLVWTEQHSKVFMRVYKLSPKNSWLVMHSFLVTLVILILLSLFLKQCILYPKSLFSIPHTRSRKKGNGYMQAFGSFGASISGIDCVEKRYRWLVSGCLEHHRPVLTKACPHKLSQKITAPKACT